MAPDEHDREIRELRDDTGRLLVGERRGGTVASHDQRFDLTCEKSMRIRSRGKAKQAFSA